MPNKGINWRCAMWKMSDGKPVRQFCKETGACYQTIWKYIVCDEIPVDKACQMGLERKGRKDTCSKFMVGDITLRQHCQNIGISYSKVYYKMIHGFSQEKAIELVESQTKATI